MTELKARLKVMPVHAFVMIFAALYSFASIFIPMFELFVQYVPYRTYSLFSLLLNPRVFTRIRSGSVDLNFQSFAAWAFVITIVLAVAALTLSLSYPFYYNSSKKRKIGYFSVLVLFRIYSDLEICHKELRNFEAAYRYSAKKLSLLSAFRG